MPIHVGDIVKKSGGHSDRGQIGIVLNVSQFMATSIILLRVSAFRDIRLIGLLLKNFRKDLIFVFDIAAFIILLI